MIVRDLRMLLEKMNSECRRAIETSVGYCVNRGHYELTWEHILYQFIDSSDNDVALLLRHYDIDTEELKKALTKDLEQFSSQNSGKPSFSPSLVALMEKSWSLATLYYGFPSITSGVMFVAAFDEMQRSIAGYAALLRPIDAGRIRTELGTVIAASAEQKRRLIEKRSTGGGKGEAAEVLEQYCTNFTKEARDGKIDFISGRDEEIRQVVDILSRRRKNNPILVGEAGVGKTAVVEGLALRICEGDVPESLKGVELWGLDLGLLQAGASVKGEFEKRLKGVIEAVKQGGGSIVLFIDEAHTLIGAGGSSGQGDAANLLKPALARGEIRTLAATTWSEYAKYFEKDPALARRFQLVKVDEPDEQKAFFMLRGISQNYEKHHGVRVTDEGVKAAVQLSHRYISGRQLPDKAVDVLDTASTRVKMSQSTVPAALDRENRYFENTKRSVEAMMRDKKAGIEIDEGILSQNRTNMENTQTRIKELSKKWDSEKEIVKNINELSAKLDDSDESSDGSVREELRVKLTELEKIQGESPMVFPHVSRNVCAQVIGDWTGIPVGSMLTDEAKALLNLENRLQQRVLGQDEALEEVANTIRASKTGMTNPDAPMGVFLFSGPSGVGKTECALALADILFGGEKFLTVINMSEYQEKHTASQLKGSPPGYVGYGEGGVLTEAVRKKPYSIVVLDEVEKAHPEVMNTFYQVFDKGMMRDGEGREIDFRNTLIIMTSNLASSQIIDLCTKEDEKEASFNELVHTIRPILSSHFQPALLGRMKIVPFRPLTSDYLKGVVALKLDQVATRLYRTHGLEFGCSPQFIDAVAQRCTAVEAGARLIDTIIGQTLLPQISRQLLAQMGEDGEKLARIFIEVDNEGEFSIGFEKDGGKNTIENKNKDPEKVKTDTKQK